MRGAASRGDSKELGEAGKSCFCKGLPEKVLKPVKMVKRINFTNISHVKTSNYTSDENRSIKFGRYQLFEKLSFPWMVIYMVHTRFSGLCHKNDCPLIPKQHIS